MIDPERIAEAMQGPRAEVLQVIGAQPYHDRSYRGSLVPIAISRMGCPVLARDEVTASNAERGSNTLLRALWQEHEPILLILERQGKGRRVVRP